MPRPVRSRVAPAKPAPAVEADQAPSARLRAGPAWDKGSASSSEMSDLYGVSDNELKRIAVERATNTAPAPAASAATKPTPRQPQPAAAAARSRADAQQTVALTDSRRRRDTAMDRLDDLTTSSTLEQQPRPQSRGRRTSRPPARGEKGVSATRETQRRHRADASGLDIMDDSELFGDLDLDADIDSSSVEGETTAPGYRSADTSSFNIAMFKRGRSRQSSVAGREDAPIRPSSRGPNTPGFSSTFNLGTFKRRPRERSILGTGRKAQADYTDTEPEPARDDGAAAAESEPDSDLELPDIEAESPTRRRTRSSAATAAAATRDSLPPMDPSPGDSRKRKSTDAQEGSSKRPALASSDDVHQSIESESELSPPPLSDSASTPPHVPPVYDDDEDVMAPPASSSTCSDGSPGFWPSLKGVAASRARRGRSNSRRRTPAAADDDDAASDMSSPPSLTHSPNYTTARNKGKGRAAAAAQQRRSPEKLTTAELTSMLPRRRRRAASNAPEDDDHEIDALAVAKGADELAYGGGSRATRSSKRPTRPLTESSSTSIAKGPNATRGAGGRKGNRRTYGSRGGLATGSDKENQSAAAVTGEEENTVTVADESSEAVLDDTFDATADTVVPPPDLGEELKNAAKKFKEVDKWELEFEEITEPSSPGIDAR
ncbi:hypothetical protein MAPG_06626 [Magnaporthiopsis poae ATCC 64411]|uniref:Uncharacterized protein n=1 Tax=Magnaporthiopsis poae (strain ATCC 64411 / 73-15) TaxID=644358 RepID=A0A0C4E2I8_MAGP6|nr:hypothetical protein MAPG_06626 [Magnaporthiopsis poae ATCC 64411]